MTPRYLAAWIPSAESQNPPVFTFCSEEELANLNRYCIDEGLLEQYHFVGPLEAARFAHAILNNDNWFHPSLPKIFRA